MCRRKYKGRAHAAMHTAPLLRQDYEPYALAVQNATASGAATSAPATDEE